MSLIYEGDKMKTDGTLIALIIIGVIGIYIFSKGKTKACIDNTTGNTRATYPIFPCGSNETAVSST
jgi:hypothetical protein